MLKIYSSIILAVLISGCSSKLTTFDSDGKEMVGVPIGKPVLVEFNTTTVFKPVVGHENFKNYCTDVNNSEAKFLPLGETYYIGFDPASFGKGEFKLEFSDSGNIKVISLNSDATAGVNATKDILGTILPYIKAPKTAPDDSETADFAPTDTTVPAEDLKKLHCLNKGTKVTSIRKIKIQE